MILDAVAITERVLILSLCKWCENVLISILRTKVCLCSGGLQPEERDVAIPKVGNEKTVTYSLEIYTHFLRSKHETLGPAVKRLFDQQNLSLIFMDFLLKLIKINNHQLTHIFGIIEYPRQELTRSKLSVLVKSTNLPVNTI